MILIQIALRNLLSHKLKSFIVGGLLIFGSILLVSGMSLLGSLDRSMAQSLVGSMSGHIQVWSAKGKDKLSLFWNPMEGTDYGQIENFPQVRKVLEGLPEVQSVVPMGIDQALVFGGNVLDRKLEGLRAAEKAHDAAKIGPLRDHLRRIVTLMNADMKGIKDISDVDKLTPEFRQGLADVAEGSKPAFWDSFDQDPLAHLEFLENKIAPMDLSMDMLFLRYMGTDPARFAQAFDRFEIVEGTNIPAGQRGFLFNKLWYEDWIKHKTARRLDKIKEHLEDGKKLKSDDEAQQWVKLNQTQYKDITYQLDEPSSKLVTSALRQELLSKDQNLDALVQAFGLQSDKEFAKRYKLFQAAPRSEQADAALRKELVDKQQDLDKLVTAFMTMDDSNFQRRYKLFYDVIAPHLMLYSVRIGDTLTLKGFTLAGYPTSANVKVYGTFRFRALDKSSLAGSTNITDLMTWRDLYGFLTQERKEELKKLQATEKKNFHEVTREDAEAQLFGDAAQEASPTTAPEAASPTALAGAATGGFDEFAGLDMKGSTQRYGEDIARRVYTQDEIDSGVVRNAAIVLKPGVDLPAAMKKVNAAIEANKLGLKAMDWREASGMVGQFIGVIYIVLATALLVIFLVAMVIINNSLVMSTMERIREIGTMRAIGAQRSEIRRMFLVEALVMAAVFGFIGCLLGGVGMLIAGRLGIPAFNDVTVFLFAGPRLYPYLAPSHILVTLVLVTLVTVASTLYPALLAMRVTPLEAMQEAE